ncbi:hypothetical protein [Microbacterium oxydans]|uniref:Uncharacterized protein n=1 Tax=Microbacterium oxydans TaxID=82380 RepID=A0A0F0L3E2_9MICO|nr:hypothetical protein [Microbacterium oxydans]KJL27663.1 hypothetical protein RS83_02715 [Microbacterium oxydans]
MRITVDDRPMTLFELLWIREAYSLVPVGDDLPPMLERTPAPAATTLDPATRRTWEAAWTRLWQGAASHACREYDPALFEQLQGTLDGSPEREALLRQMFGPNWGDEMGRDAFDDPSYTDWDQAMIDAHMSTRRDVLEHSPERRAVTALTRAWRGGIAKIVTIPCRGEYTRRLTSDGLLVTAETRADIPAYERALDSA